MTNTGWALIPTYAGLQSSCSVPTPPAWDQMSSDPNVAWQQGGDAGSDALSQLSALGFPANTVAYLDIEPFTSGCDASIISYINGFTSRMFGLGAIPGVYGPSASAMKLMVANLGVGGFNPPNDVWMAGGPGDGFYSASYDMNATVWGDAYVPDGYWQSHQRLRQYSPDHLESYGGVAIDLDSDCMNGQVVGVDHHTDADAGTSEGPRDADDLTCP